MKRKIIYLSLVIASCFIISCGGGKSADPAPANVTSIPTNTGSSGGTGGTGSTPSVTPTYALLLTIGNSSTVNNSLVISSSKYTIVNAVGTQTAISFSTGGSIKGELKNIALGTLTSESPDDYTRYTYPSNVFTKVNNAIPTPAIADTATKVCLKFSDPTAKDASGNPIIKFLFLYNSGGAGAGGLGLISATKLPATITVQTLNTIYTRNDYK